jgi:L-histidine Nalpha-methyltransferase
VRPAEGGIGAGPIGQPLPDPGRDFAREVCRDLQLSPPQLQSKYLYDPLGSCLFEAICRLPWYCITAAEQRLLSRHAPAIASDLTQPLTIVELGCGSGEKLAILVQAITRRGRGARVHLIDISPTALEQSERTLTSYGPVSVVGHRTTYEIGLHEAAAGREQGGTLLVLFLGSNIGNFDPPAALDFLGIIRQCLDEGDALLLGTDLVKPEAELLRAYDDPLGITAAFNKNLLLRINRELGGNFDLDGFEHRAIWNAPEARVEMHLVSRRAQTVRLAAGDCSVAFGPGDAIWTESSYKYVPDQVVEMLGRSRFECRERWIDQPSRFMLTLFRAV